MQNLGDIFKSKTARSSELVEKLRAKTTGVAVRKFPKLQDGRKREIQRRKNHQAEETEMVELRRQNREITQLRVNQFRADNHARLQNMKKSWILKTDKEPEYSLSGRGRYFRVRHNFPAIQKLIEALTEANAELGTMVETSSLSEIEARIQHWSGVIAAIDLTQTTEVKMSSDDFYSLERERDSEPGHIASGVWDPSGPVQIQSDADKYGPRISEIYKKLTNLESKL